MWNDAIETQRTSVLLDLQKSGETVSLSCDAGFHYYTLEAAMMHRVRLRLQSFLPELLDDECLSLKNRDANLAKGRVLLQAMRAGEQKADEFIPGAAWGYSKYKFAKRAQMAFAAFHEAHKMLPGRVPPQHITHTNTHNTRNRAFTNHDPTRARIHNAELLSGSQQAHSLLWLVWVQKGLCWHPLAEDQETMLWGFSYFVNWFWELPLTLYPQHHYHAQKRVAPVIATAAIPSAICMFVTTTTHGLLLV
jgi:hypothetical protein